MRVVVDTNVIVSHYITPAAPAAQVLAAWRAERYDLVTSEPMLAELGRVLAYPHLQVRHHMDEAEIAAVISGFRDLAIVVDPIEEPEAVKDDPDDNKFLAAAVAGAAAVIVSGDRDVLRLGSFEDIPILTPQAFLLVLEHEEGTRQ